MSQNNDSRGACVVGVNVECVGSGKKKIRMNVSPQSLGLVFHLRSPFIVYPVLCLVHRQIYNCTVELPRERWAFWGSNFAPFGRMINLSLSIYHRFYVLSCTSGLKTDVKKFISCFLTSLWSTSCHINKGYQTQREKWVIQPRPQINREYVLARTSLEFNFVLFVVLPNNDKNWILRVLWLAKEKLE